MSRVQLLARTVLTDEAYDILPELDEITGPADHLGELSGRQCYESFHRPNAKTAENADYLANIQDQKHFSVLSHASFTFRFTGISRSLSHEFIRSRWWSFSEVSQRYVNMSDSYTVVPPLFRGDNGIEWLIQQNHAASVDLYERLVERAIAEGATRKQAREAARCVLPGGTETKLVASANCRAIRDWLQQRWSMHADMEIREVAGEVLSIVRQYAPNTFADIPETPAAWLR